MRVLVTCPPMIGAKEKFLPLFETRGWEAVIPEFTQVMSEQALCEAVPQCDGWIIGDDPATRRVFEAGVSGRLKAAVKWGIGTDNVDFKACQELSIPIANTPQMFGNEVADVALGYVVCLARDLMTIDREVRQGNWYKPQGQSLSETTIGVVGYGDIGRQTCHRMKALGSRVVSWDPGVPPSQVEQGVELLTWPRDIDACDYLILTCNLNDANHHMINADILSQLKRGAKVINVARGPLIDENALYEALRGGQVSGAALDVFEVEPVTIDNRLLSFPGVLVGSHNGSNTLEGVMRANAKAISLLEGFLND